MKGSIKKTVALLCAAIFFTLTLTSCVGSDKYEINISVLSGSTGFGAAQLISDTSHGQTHEGYGFTVENDASLITSALISGEVDIAALPTNAAAALYNKTDGKIKIAAVNTLGVLYVLTSDETITTLADLEGRTVYAPAQNPAFIFEAICRENGLISGENITIDTAYSAPADLRAALLSDKVDVAVLPEPMVTIALSANPSLRVAIDLTDEWEKSFGKNTLMQGCIVVRTEWAEQNPDKLEKFLADYKKSVQFTVDEPKKAAHCIVEVGIFAGKAEIAEAAIPKCNIKYIDGEEMSAGLNQFFEILYSVAPQAVGGRIPDDGIYVQDKD